MSYIGIRGIYLNPHVYASTHFCGSIGTSASYTDNNNYRYIRRITMVDRSSTDKRVSKIVRSEIIIIPAVCTTNHI